MLVINATSKWIVKVELCYDILILGLLIVITYL